MAKENTPTLRKTCARATFSTRNPARTGLGSNLNFVVDRPET
jgi:hypothetical protein